LPKPFRVEIPTGLYLGDGTRKTRTDTVPHFVTDASIECSCFSIEAKVVSVQCDALRERSDAVQVRPHGEAVNLARADTAHDLESVSASGFDRTWLELRTEDADYQV
jgi:hypothetical protein